MHFQVCFLHTGMICLSTSVNMCQCPVPGAAATALPSPIALCGASPQKCRPLACQGEQGKHLFSWDVWK